MTRLGNMRRLGHAHCVRRASVAALVLAGVGVVLHQVASVARQRLTFTSLGSSSQSQASPSLALQRPGGRHGLVAYDHARDSSFVARSFFGPFAGVSENPDGRRVYIALVDAAIKRDDMASFEEATKQNCRQSVKEDTNVRFDLVKSSDTVGGYRLMEIYKRPEGPIEHKKTDHYNKWRNEVQGMQRRNRTATFWDTILPDSADGYEPVALLLEREGRPTFVNVTYYTFDIAYGSEEKFEKVTRAYVKDTLNEDDVYRYDFLTSVDKPRRYMIIEVRKVLEETRNEMLQNTQRQAHECLDYFLRWREVTSSMLAGPRVVQSYFNVFPNVPSAWFSVKEYGAQR